VKSARRSARGLTLLELLVTLVLVSLIVGIVWQALGQLARIERLLAGTQLQSLNQALRAEWVRGALEGLLPGDAAAGDRFKGSALELVGLTAEAPAYPSPVVARVSLSIEYSVASNTTALWLRQPDGDKRRSTSVIPLPTPLLTPLLSWPGRSGRLRYLDAAGTWQDRWPVSDEPGGPALPSAILLETGLEDAPTLIAVTRASAAPLPTRRLLETM